MAFGDIIRQQLLDDNRKKVNMMHWCFIKDLMSINIDIDIKKGKRHLISTHGIMPMICGHLCLLKVKDLILKKCQCTSYHYRRIFWLISKLAGLRQVQSIKANHLCQKTAIIGRKYLMIENLKTFLYQRIHGMTLEGGLE